MVLDEVAIFKRNGVLLYRRSLAAVKGNFVGGTIINHLIRTVLLEERAGATQATLEKHIAKWTMANREDLVFVLIYNKIIYANLNYVDEFLARLKEDFLAAYPAKQLETATHPLEYEARFMKLLTSVEARARAKRVKSSGPSGGARTRGIQVKVKTEEDNQQSTEKELSSPEDDGEEGDTDEDNPETEASYTEDDEDRGQDHASAAARARAAMARRAGNKKTAGGPRKGPIGSGEGLPPRAPGRKERQWHDGTGKISRAAMAALDRSEAKGADIWFPDPSDVCVQPPESAGRASDNLEESAALRETKATYLPLAGEKPEWEQEDTLQVMADVDDEITSGASSDSSGSEGKGFLSRFLTQLTGNATLCEADLNPILEDMRQMLIGKNVASEIAQDICDSVRTSLVGQRLPSLTRVKSVVREALQKAIVRVLTPTRSTDLMREIMLVKSLGRPYTIVFVGINGVGKSTSLSKVCYYLKNHGLKVMIAACDTFRSGAVEQLKVHARCLEVPLFDKGYHKDPAAVAKDAIREASEKGHDVVLIDTAGRMQNKEPLMRALAKLVADNTPDLTLFVGEALVGNDGIDQIMLFNQALANYSPPGKQHHIDGIILTKFDTVDEKVGAALSMSYKTGQPIMFVGTGQKYTHLKKMNVNLILNCLFR